MLVGEADVALGNGSHLTVYTLHSRSDIAHVLVDTGTAERPALTIAAAGNSALNTSSTRIGTGAWGRSGSWDNGSVGSSGSTRSNWGSSSAGDLDEGLSLAPSPGSNSGGDSAGGTGRSSSRSWAGNSARRSGAGTRTRTRTRTGTGLGAITRDGGSSSTEDLRTGILELNGLDTLRDSTSITRVGTEHIWESVESGSGGLGTRDNNSGALHIHLPVSKSVEPGPCDNCLTSGEARRNLEVERRQDMSSVWGKIAIGLDRVVAFP